jgi:hypothetical protein
MSTVTLRFKIPSESEQFLDSFNGPSYRFTLQDMDNYLRNKLKYAEMPAEVADMVHIIRQQLHAIADEKGIKIWE